jgi:hypothetical protein
MAYQDDFRNKVLAALKAKNLAVDISQEATQQAIVEEAQNVAASEPIPMSPEDMKLILQDVAKQLAIENQQLAIENQKLAAQNQAFSAQSSDFTAFAPGLEGVLDANDGSYSGGGIAVSVANKDIVIIPANGGLGAAGSATSVNSISQIDFKYIANPNAYATFDPKEVKASLFNWGERVVGNTYDTPVLGIGGAWNGVSYAPTPQWGVGNSFGSGVGGSINQLSGFGQIIFFKPASSTIYAALFNDVAISSDFANSYVSIIGYNSAVPGSFPTAGFAVSFGGIGGSGALAISGAATASQLNRVRFLSPLTITNSTVTDTLTLALSSPAGTAGTQYFVGNGSTQQYVLSTNNLFVSGDMFYASAAGHTHLTRLAKGNANSYLSVDGSNNYTWTSTISASTANVAAASGSTVLYPIMNNSTVSGSALSYDVDFYVDPSANILRYAGSNSGQIWAGLSVSSPTYTSAAGVVIKPGTDSTFGIQLQTSTGGTFLNLDTTNRRVGVGTSGPLYPLDVVGDINAATGYSYRIAGNLVINATTLGTNVVNSSLTSVGTIGTGVWQGTAIATTYGGTGSNLSATGNSNKIVVLGPFTSSNAATVIDGANTGYLLSANGNGVAPSFVNTTSAAFTFTGGVAFNTNAATSNVTPSSGNDLTNKSYVDSISGGLDPHASVRLTTVSAIGGSYRQLSGTSGTTWGTGDYILATTLAQLIGSETGFDTPTSGIALTFNQRVLVKDGVTGGYASGINAWGVFPTTYGGIAASYVANGIYTVTSVGGAATSGWLLVRATDTDNQSGVQELTGGTFTFVEEGTNFADNAFVCTNDTTSLGPIGFGATQITWSPFSGGASLAMGQGLAKSGNIVATNFNFTNDGNLVSGITYQGFSIGGARSSSVGSSSRSSFTVTVQGGHNDVASSTLTLNTTGFKLSGGATARGLTIGGTGDATSNVAADGFSYSGGSTSSRTLTVAGGNIALNGAGFGLTLGSTSVLSTNFQTLVIGSGTSNITFQSSSANGTTASTTQYLVQNGQSQYILSTNNSAFLVGDMYYASGTAHTQMSRIAFSAGNGNSVLISNGATPAWGKIALADTNMVSGTLSITNGGTNAVAGNFTTNGVVIYDGTNLRLASATGLTMIGGTGLSVTGTVSASSGYFVGSTAVLSGTAGQVAYYGGSNTAIGTSGFAFSPTAATGVGLSVAVSSATGTIFQVNTFAAMTAGNLIDFDINGVQRFGVDWKGMATHTNNSSLGNTALVVAGGRTILSGPNSNYASLNFGNTNANPGAGITQIGDLWFNGTNLYFRKDAATSFDLLVGSVSGTGIADRIAKWSSTTGLTSSFLSESPAGVGMTITSSSTSIAAGGGTTALLTLQSIALDDNKTDRYFIRGMSTGAGAATTRYFSIDTAGNLRATTKSFDIPHPTKEGLRLVYGVLEGPEHGVYHRGTVEGKGVIQVNLPDYWHKLVGGQYTIQLTPWGNYNVGIGSKTENYFTIQLVGDAISRKFKNIKVDYIVHGSRLDAPLDTEQ